MHPEENCFSESSFYHGSLQSSLLYLGGLLPAPATQKHALGGGVGERRPSKYTTQQLNCTPRSEVPSQPSAAITILGYVSDPESPVLFVCVIVGTITRIPNSLPTHLIVLQFVPCWGVYRIFVYDHNSFKPKDKNVFTDVSIKTYWVKVWYFSTGDRDDEKKNSDTYCIIC